MDGPPRSPRFTIPVVEVLVVVAILSTLVGFLLPAVEAAREMRGQPPSLPWLKPLFGGPPGLFLVGAPVVVTGSVAAILGMIRLLLPRTIRECISWAAPAKPPAPPREPISDPRPAVLSSAMALGATAILVFVAAHVRADRTHRRPIVTWEGPIADYVQFAAASGWLLSAISIALGTHSLSRFRGRWNVLAAFGLCLSLLNFFGSCVFFGVVYED